VHCKGWELNRFGEWFGLGRPFAHSKEERERGEGGGQSSLEVQADCMEAAQGINNEAMTEFERSDT
jgi:hypothetical protein